MNDELKIISLYLEGNTARKVAEMIGCGQTKVFRILYKNNIGTRKRKIKLDVDKVKDMFMNNTPIDEIANAFGVSRSVIHNRLSEMGINFQLHKFQMKHPDGQYTSYVNSGGYIAETVPIHLQHLYGGKKNILQHRRIMEEHIGRKLYENESVHHKNGNRQDNRIENLELWVKSQPYGQRPEDLVKWAKEILERYDN